MDGLCVRLSLIVSASAHSPLQGDRYRRSRPSHAFFVEVERSLVAPRIPGVPIEAASKFLIFLPICAAIPASTIAYYVLEASDTRSFDDIGVSPAPFYL